eukprot:4888970-Alexandrium_andersonii.AAC.1
MNSPSVQTLTMLSPCASSSLRSCAKSTARGAPRRSANDAATTWTPPAGLAEARNNFRAGRSLLRKSRLAAK